MTGSFGGVEWAKSRPDEDLDPDPRDLVRELREALGLFAGALPYSPKRAWEEAIAEVKRLRHNDGPGCAP